MRIFEVKYENGYVIIEFADSKADVWHKHPKAWLVYEVIVK